MSPAISQILFLAIFIAVMYLLLIRPQRRKEKAVNLMRSNIQVGDEIVTIGGICGKVVKTKDETLVIQVGADKTKFEVMRWAISRVVEPSVKTSQKKGPVEPVEEEGEEAKKTLPKRMKRATDENDAPAETADSELDGKQDIADVNSDEIDSGSNGDEEQK